MIDPRLVVLRDWLAVQMAPAPDIDDILARLGDDACGRLVWAAPTAHTPIVATSLDPAVESVPHTAPFVNIPETSDDDA